MPRSYQVTPKVLGRRRATQALPVRPASRHSSLESARRQPENQPQPSDVTAQTRAIVPVTGVSVSFFGSLKKELVHRQSWPTKADARSAVFDYIEAFYNPVRLHSTLHST